MNIRSLNNELKNQKRKKLKKKKRKKMKMEKEQKKMANTITIDSQMKKKSLTKRAE